MRRLILILVGISISSCNNFKTITKITTKRNLSAAIDKTDPADKTKNLICNITDFISLGLFFTTRKKIHIRFRLPQQYSRCQDVDFTKMKKLVCTNFDFISTHFIKSKNEFLGGLLCAIGRVEEIPTEKHFVIKNLATAWKPVDGQCPPRPTQQFSFDNRKVYCEPQNFKYKYTGKDTD